MISLRCIFLVLFLPLRHGAALAPIAPRLGDNAVVDWWFAYKMNSYAFPGCRSERQCIFGGTVQNYSYGYSQQYLLSSSIGGKTQEFILKTDCLGTGADPVAQTFKQIYSGDASNYVIWNDQFYGEPAVNLNPPCHPTYCSSPWGHSKGAIAWDGNGDGFIMQVTSPDWPGSGNPAYGRETQGNTLGCCKDDNVLVAQHFFALKLTASDTKTVLMAMQHASVVTDPSNAQLVKLTDGPENLAELARGLGKLKNSSIPFKGNLNHAQILAKPQALHVPTWQMVSAVLAQPLRVASWWESPEILSAKAGVPGCWSSNLNVPKEVQVATSGMWMNVTFGLTGGFGKNYNHAKLAHSLDGNLAVLGDMNQMGSYSPQDGSCDSSQNGRGGMFFIINNTVLHGGLVQLMTGKTAKYYSNCGGPGTYPCTTGCTYVRKEDEGVCGVSEYGCYDCSTLSPGCPECSGPAPQCAGAGAYPCSAGCTYIRKADAQACGVSMYGCYDCSKLSSSCPECSSQLVV